MEKIFVAFDLALGAIVYATIGRVKNQVLRTFLWALLVELVAIVIILIHKL